MNQLSKIVSQTLNGNDFIIVKFSGKSHKIYAPHTITVSRMLEPLSYVDIANETSIMNVIKTIGEQSNYIAHAIAIAIVGDKPQNIFYKIKIKIIVRQILRCTCEELLIAFSAVLSLINAQAFFDCARLAMEMTNQMAKPQLQ